MDLPTDAPDPAIRARYDGLGGPLFKLVLTTGLLTVVTLGIYRFWARTRIRRYIWAATSLDRDPLEYTGTGREKLLGFLVAVVVLAVLLGLLQLGLAFFGLSMLAPEESEDLTAVGLFAQFSFLLLTPLLFAARYRAERYRLSRTRWRGIRFGMLPGTFGYTWRAVGYYLLTVLSLGLLLPLQTFRLEQFRTDRTVFGASRLRQGGRWTMLYRPMVHLFIGATLILVSTALLAAPFAEAVREIGHAEGVGDGDAGARLQVPTGLVFLWLGLAFVGVVWVVVGWVHYRVQSFARLSATKTLDGEIGARAAPSTGIVVGHFIWGSFKLSILFFAILLAAVLVLGILGAVASVLVPDGVFEQFDPNAPEAAGAAAIAALAVPIIAGIFVLLAVAEALRMAVIVQPIYGHIVSSLTLTNPALLDHVQQRADDSIADADGFADALDVGGAF